MACDGRYGNVWSKTIRANRDDDVARSHRRGPLPAKERSTNVKGSGRKTVRANAANRYLSEAQLGDGVSLGMEGLPRYQPNVGCGCRAEKQPPNPTRACCWLSGRGEGKQTHLVASLLCDRQCDAA
jgi:hypothetical protein